MRFTTPAIAWHDIKPVFSIDFHTSGRLATAGADRAINVWKVEPEGNVVFLSQLLKHTRAVNAIKFSPDGRFLASTGDDGIIYIWKLLEEPSRVQGMMDSSMPEMKNQEEWGVVSTLSRGGSDIFALDWSPDSTQLLAGAFDGAVYIWHLTKQYGQRYHEIRDHWTLVQGVSFDPLGSMLVTLSADRSARIYKKSKNGHKLYCAHHLRIRVTDIELDSKVSSTNLLGEAQEPDEEHNRFFQHKYFLDDSAPTFFRRPAWSPEGKILLLPCGHIWESPAQKTPINVTWLFTRGNCTKPSSYIPSTDVSVVAVFSPVLYKCRSPSNGSSASPSNSSNAVEENPNSMPGVESTMEASGGISNSKFFDLDYMMVYAIATLTAVYIYDTEHLHPIASFKDGHYDKITDLAFSPDGKALAISSSDGYVSLIQFDDGELGDALDQDHADKVLQPAKSAMIPKPKVPRKPKAPTSTSETDKVAPNAESNAADGTSQGENGMQGVETASETNPAPASTEQEGAGSDEEEDDDDSLEEMDGFQGAIVNFDDPTPINPTPNSAPATPVVRKQGRRVVATLINPDGSSIEAQTP